MTSVIASVILLFFLFFLVSFRTASGGDPLKPRTRSFSRLVARRSVGLYVRDDTRARRPRRFRRKVVPVPLPMDPMEQPAEPS
ncbi:hypothetical protein [Spirillospora sp. NPDC047279]|uniref:hypothetical protein n=1 Tax=Spirillospora sp. NPDC047279 TaxID=3155478 RepID=UPI0033F760F7